MERIDDVLGYKDLKIFQNSDYFAFSLDSIILANYSTVRLRDNKIIDFCTGNGIIPLIISRRCNKSIIGVEDANKVPGVVQVSIVHGIGEKVGEIRSSVDRIGFVITNDADPANAIKRSEEALQLIKVKYTK